MKRNLITDIGDEVNINTIYCLGSNYSKHIKEMGGKTPQEPVIFIKPNTSFINDGDAILLPDFSNNVHHEVELVVVIKEDCRNVSEEDAYNFVLGYAIGIDVTLRDIQNNAKQNGHPWAVAKGFYTSAPISKIITNNELKNKDSKIELFVNGVLKQSAFTSEMERNVAQIISYLSKVFYLVKGDCIFTGTPEGVGKIQSGDILEAKLDGITLLNIKVQ